MATNKYLQRLTLHHVTLEASFFTGFDHGLIQNKVLDALDLEDCALAGACTNDAVAGMFQALAAGRLSHVSRLALPPLLWTESLCSAFRTYLEGACQLRHLSLAGARGSLNDESFGQIIPDSLFLETLVVASHVSLSGNSFRRFTENLATNRSLKSLELWGWNVEGDILENLIRSATDNYTLESVRLSSDCSSQLERLRIILQLNRAGRKYLVNNVDCDKGRGIEVIAEVSSDLDCLLVLLLENPSLCSR
jgi:hypothetical protein